MNFNDLLNDTKRNRNAEEYQKVQIRKFNYRHKKRQQQIHKEIEKSNSKFDRKTYINRKHIYSNEYERKIQSLKENEKCTKEILHAARKMARHHHGDHYEDLYFVLEDGNQTLSKTDYKTREYEVAPSKKMKTFAKNNPNKIIAIHNHPNNSLPSDADLISCNEHKYKYGLIICHNGIIYKYKTLEEFNNRNAAAALNIFEAEKRRIKNEFGKTSTAKIKHKANSLELKQSLKNAGVILTRLHKRKEK